MYNFKAKGSKLDYIERETRGQKGSRWSKAASRVMKQLEEIGAMHIISYLDAIYASKVTKNEPMESIHVKREKKHDS